jgi:hypothetical protein
MQEQIMEVIKQHLKGSNTNHYFDSPEQDAEALYGKLSDIIEGLERDNRNLRDTLIATINRFQG